MTTKQIVAKLKGLSAKWEESGDLIYHAYVMIDLDILIAEIEAADTPQVTPAKAAAAYREVEEQGSLIDTLKALCETMKAQAASSRRSSDEHSVKAAQNRGPLAEMVSDRGLQLVAHETMKNALAGEADAIDDCAAKLMVIIAHHQQGATEATKGVPW